METKMIGYKIAEARKNTNISQAQLAERLFISPQAVGKWERGESMPDITTFNRLAQILGVDLNYFSENFESKVPKQAPVELGNTPLNVSDLVVTDQTSTGTPTRKPNWDMSRGNWVDADFSGLKNLHEKFSESNMQFCKFIGSNLSGLTLKSNNIDRCDFSGSKIDNSRVQSSNLNKNIFKNCTLKEAAFSKSHIDSCDFTGAQFINAQFSESFLYGCNLTGVDFTGVSIRSGGLTGVASKSGNIERNTIEYAVWNRTSFVDTQIADLIFTGALEDCYFENCAFTRVKFENTTFKNTFFKNNKKLKRISFVGCKADRMTYEFLKQGKADLTGIALLPEIENE